MQLDIILKALKEKYKLEVVTQEPRVAYRETITKKAEAQYKHKKQSGGHGQYGEVYFRMAPRARGAGYQFTDSIVGGVVPKNYIPGVEKGVEAMLETGPRQVSRSLTWPWSSITGPIMTSIHRKCPSRSPRASCFKKAMEPAGPQLPGAGHGGEGFRGQGFTWATS